MLLGVLPTAPESLASAPAWTLRLRRFAGIGGLVAFVVVLCPPLITAMVHQGYLEVLQYLVLALVVPPLVVAAAPLRGTRLAPFAGRLSEGRRRHASFARSGIFLALELAALILWRVPVLVDALVRDRVLVIAEVLTLVPAGIAFWLELIDSAPLVPRLGPGPARAVLAALTMWTTWILAYIAAFSTSWYPVYDRARESRAAIVTDQQVMSGLMWLVSAVVFLPVIFVTLRTWLDDTERPDAELRRLVREERRRAFGPPPTEARRKSGGAP